MVSRYLVNHKILVLLIVFAFFICAAYHSKTNMTAENQELKSKTTKQSIEAKIDEKANSIFDAIVEIRRDIHKHPELSGQEVRTAKIIAEQLKSFGLEVRNNIGGHGVVGILRGNLKGPVVAYRADMDALNQDIQEQVPFISVTPGVSHACGHDVHTAVGLGIAQVLSFLKEELPGTVKFIFQPAEEIALGAKQMIDEGVLKDPAPDVIFAIHVIPAETGIIATSPGVGLTGVNYYTIRLTESNNLDRATQSCLNAVRAIGTINYPKDNEEYQRIFAAIFEKNSFISDFIWAIANIDDKSSSNQEKIIKGFFKASDHNAYKRAYTQLYKVVSDLNCEGTLCEVSFTDRFPDMFCDKEIATQAIIPLKAILGEDSVLTVYNSFPFFQEDFAYYLQKIPGAMFFLGASNTAEGIVAFSHSPNFSVDEKAILVGIKGMTNVIIHYLKQLSK